MCLDSAFRLGDVFPHVGHFKMWSTFWCADFICLRTYCSFLYERPHIWQLALGSSTSLCSFKCVRKLFNELYTFAQIWHTCWFCRLCTTFTCISRRILVSNLQRKPKHISRFQLDRSKSHVCLPLITLIAFVTLPLASMKNLHMRGNATAKWKFLLADVTLESLWEVYALMWS